MRDPNRIDRITETIRRVWHLVPDWRLGQLACNLGRECGSWDCFYTEDDALEAAAMMWLKQNAEDEDPSFVLTKKHYSNFQDAVEAAEKLCGSSNFEIRSNSDHTYDLIYDNKEEDKTE